MTPHPRYAAKRDDNEPEIIAALLELGASVHPLITPIDLLVGYKGRTWLMEVKNPKGLNRTTPDQERFMSTWLGGEVHIVRSPKDALERLVSTAEARRVLDKLVT